MAASFPTSIRNFSSVINGVTKLVASLFNSPYDEITAIETALGVDMANVRFGSWVSKSPDTTYQATTDGFLVVYGYSEGSTGRSVRGYTDGNNPPTTKIVGFEVGSAANRPLEGSFCMPVKKNDYYKAYFESTAITYTIYWIPLGG